MSYNLETKPRGKRNGTGKTKNKKIYIADLFCTDICTA